MINCTMDFGFVPDNEFVELVWENGKIVMQGQSSRAKKSSFPNCPFANSPNVKERDGGDAVIPKIGKHDNLDPIMNGFSSPGPPGHVGLVEDDEMVRWLNYPFGDSSQSDYCSELFPELAESNVSCVSTQNNAVVFDKIGGHGQVGKDSHIVSPQTSGKHEHKSPSEAVGGSERSRIRSSQSFSQQQCQNLVSNIGPSGSNFNTNNSTNIHQAAFRNLTQSPPSATGMPNVKMQKKDLASTVSTEPSENTSLMNFSHFSRPVSLFKANLQGMNAASAGFSSVDRLKRNAKVSITGSNQIESSMVDLTSGSKSVVGVQNQHAPSPSKVDLRSYCKSSVELVSVGKSEATYQDDPYRNNNPPGDVLPQSSSFALSVALGVSESEKTLEPVVASSSVCSGNSTGGVSNDPKHGMKRKAGEVEQSEYQSEDIEDESVDLKKPTKIPKRSRSTEVHNLSERRRRDRINEKMRALQELIPNCSKVDKASMLDDAIEYLKTLQLQVQMMSMGSGFCMPPMVLPTGIPHVSTQPMLHLPPIGVGFGMGMGAGFGMGIPDANFSPSRPMIPVTPIHGAQYPYSSVPGAANFHGMHVSSFQMFGVPGQGLPFARPCTPFIPMSGGFYTKELPVHNVSEPAIPVSVPDSTLPLKDQTENVNLQTMHKTSVDSSMIQMTTQASNECSESCDLMQTYNRASPVNGNKAINIVSDNGVASTGT